jgi:pyruvate,orthophosphate dikinase
VEDVQRRVDQLHESNPMLGHRGCRLCITYPEILEMQVRAIMTAAAECTQRGIKVLPEIMIPLTIDAKELQILTDRTRAVADSVLKERNIKINYMVGTMVETPRAALCGGAMAEVAEFFSFGTNDLTQTTFGLSRDDAGPFIQIYLDKGIMESDPFITIEQDSVGELVRIGADRGRQTRPDIKIGICGEHGGDPATVHFCQKVGLDYVSCSPYRVPIARLAAAQAALGVEAETNA